MPSIQFKREDQVMINGVMHRYWDPVSGGRGMHYVYLDVSIKEMSSAEVQKYRQMKYFYTMAMNRPYFEVPEYELVPRTNRQASTLLSQEE